MRRRSSATFRGKVMSRITIPIIVFALAAGPAIAQNTLARPVVIGMPSAPDLSRTPQLAAVAPPAKLPSAILDNSISFDYQTAIVKQDGRRWQIWAGKTMVKDFADNREQAYEARRLIADLKLTEH